MLTSHCDKSHCFEEIKDNTLLVQVYGDFLPTKILNKFAILCSILRQFYLTICLIFNGDIAKYDLFVVDQLSFCIPFLHLYKKPGAKILFYCHHPDLLAASHDSFVRSLYRKPFDFIEGFSTGCSDNIVVNSSYTKSIFKATFQNLSHLDPEIVYPCVPLTLQVDPKAIEEVDSFFGPYEFFISINRFDKPKNIELAIESFKIFLDNNPNTNVKLVVAGGFDSRNWKNVHYLIELEELCKKLNLVCFTFRGKLIQLPRNCQVLFLVSISSSIKDALINRTKLLLYSPLNEHFGIVPLEAMKFNKPVLAVNHGGPLETVVEGKTGFLRNPDPSEWAVVLSDILKQDPKIFEYGSIWVKQNFSMDSMTNDLLKSIESTQVKAFKFDWIGTLLKRFRYIILLAFLNQVFSKVWK